jgi:2-polyprenyl-3-methyl-5-hydroxy-6-metoxy-1,4-benzoquinol methylase
MNCPVCLHPASAPALTGADILFETSSRPFKLSACAACHSLFLDPTPGANEIAGFYPAHYWWKPSTGILKALERCYRRIALYDHVRFITSAAQRAAIESKRARLLDVGCGSGTLLGILKQQGFDVLGLDSSKEAAAIAKAEYDVDVFVGSLEEAGFPDASFDLVTLFHVMEHVTTPRDVLISVRRILKPNGRVVLQVPNIESWQCRLFGSKWYGLDIPRHVIDYSNTSMRMLLRDCGFSVHRLRHFNLRDNAPAFASSMFPSLDPVSRAVRLRQRGVEEPALLAWVRHLAYFASVVAAYPFAVAESAAGSGATIMIEAVKSK